MTVPSRVEAARLLLSLDPPAWHVRHSRAVAEIAGWLARRIQDAAGSPGGDGSEVAVDRRLVEGAALLHDVDKAMSRAVRGDGRHGTTGAAWLGRRGHPELAKAVSLHPVTVLADDATAAGLEEASIEAQIVAYADKRAGQRLEPMAERFARWGRRHPHGRSGGGWSPAVAEAAWRRSLALEAMVCARAKCRPDEVRRLRWTASAIALARAVPPAAARSRR